MNMLKVSFSSNFEAFGFEKAFMCTLEKHMSNMKIVRCETFNPAKNNEDFISPHRNTAQSIGHLHDDVILLLRSESVRVLLSSAN